ncbi:hypothetical protein Hanom_Chr09g00832961 [Helianthus anomalus]
MFTASLACACVAHWPLEAYRSILALSLSLFVWRWNNGCTPHSPSHSCRVTLYMFLYVNMFSICSDMFVRLWFRFRSCIRLIMLLIMFSIQLCYVLAMSV